MFELSRKGTMGFVCLGDHHHAGGILVQPMDQPRPFFSSNRRHRAAGRMKMMEQGIDQRSDPMTWRRMDYEAGRLIQEQQQVVLIEDLKWNRLAFEFQRLRFWNVKGDRVSRFDLLTGLDDLTIDSHTPLPNQPLHG